MIISKTPLRISFFGGGTDYPAYYEQHGGEVLSTTINQYVYVTVRRLQPFFDYRIRVAYSKTELVKHFSEVQHPSVRHCLGHIGVEDGIEVSVTSDLPARSGLGSSSSFTVGLLHALTALQGKLISQEELAREAIFVEQKLIGEKVGCQDQVGTAVGGIRHIVFSKNDLFDARPLPVSSVRLNDLQDHLMLYFTGITRFAEDILTEQCERVNDNLKALEAMRGQVQEGCAILCDEHRDLADFGKLLGDAWNLKKSLSSKISNSLVDQAYETALKNGALGGKLLGAGGGGFLLLFVPPDAQNRVRELMLPLVEVPFRFESNGSRLIYYSA